MPDALRRRLRSFVHAGRGGWTLIATQPNARLHFAATFAVLAAGVFCNLSGIEWSLIALAIALVWMAEALNTAVEFLADEVTLEQRERIGRAKDVAAFGVLAAAFATATAGAIVFLPYIVDL